MYRLSKFASANIPFLFIFPYDKSECFFIQKISEINPKNILYKIGDIQNFQENIEINKKIIFNKYPIDFEEYKIKFYKVLDEIKAGNTYLLNLTLKTEIDINLTLKEIFFNSISENKIYFKNKFISFSPESFIKIINNKMSTFPMKGTILASEEDAKNKILKNKKELAEHIMIIDLMRNDLSKIGKNTKVDRFRFIQRIKAWKEELLQVSSEISTELEDNWRFNLTDIFQNILPAGSITGTPKISTINIINKIEKYNRGFYTGIFGIFDGKNLYSSVLIRFLEKNKDKFYYKSGGGITLDSSPNKEYKEYIDKIYIPLKIKG